MTQHVPDSELTRIGIAAGQVHYRLLCEQQSLNVNAEDAGNSALSGEVTLTLLHEGLGCIELWRDFPDRLWTTFGQPVLTYSRLGYGQSDAIDLPRAVSYMHDESGRLGKILDALQIEKTILIGHSDGASIAAIYAGESADPRVCAVVLISPHFFCESKSLESIRNARIQWDTGMLRRQLARYHGNNVDCAFLGWNEVWLNPDFKQWNIEQSLASVDVPILGLQRSTDPYGSARQLEVITETKGHEREIHFIEGTGHAPHQEEPEQTMDILNRFFMKHDFF